MRACWQIAIALAGAVGVGLVGSAAAQDKQLTIGVSHLSLGFPYAVALQNGELKAAKELGVKTIELDARANPLNQANDIDKLIAQHVDGIVMVPIDSIAAQDWADKAKAAGIPIVALAVFVGDAKKHQPPWIYPALLAYADRNDVDQAYAVGKLAVADNPNGGKIAIVEGFPGFAAVELRALGFEKALKESNAHFEVVARQAGNWDPERAHQICQDANSSSSRYLDHLFTRSGDGSGLPLGAEVRQIEGKDLRHRQLQGCRGIDPRWRANRNHLRQSGDEWPSGNDSAR